ncbi:MAG: MarR family transcriptional regulator [Gluconacetobacter diazotrophicus]|nr:MarR family transcriptional regulator [Gluconacetobacter diazotrophicus]
MSAPLPLDSQLCFSLYATSIAINRVYKPVLDELGLTYPQFLVLQAAREEDERTVGSIAARLALEPSTVTPVIKRMETAGLLSRSRDPKDERHVLIRLTAAGRALWARTGCLAETMLARSGMSMQELSALNTQVRALHEALAAPAA